MGSHASQRATEMILQVRTEGNPLLPRDGNSCSATHRVSLPRSEASMRGMVPTTVTAASRSPWQIITERVMRKSPRRPAVCGTSCVDARMGGTTLFGGDLGDASDSKSANQPDGEARVKRPDRCARPRAASHYASPGAHTSGAYHPTTGRTPARRL